MRNIRFVLDVGLVVLIVIGLYISSSQPYQKQDIRGSIERFLGGGQIEQQFDGFSLRYAGKEISSETVGFAGFVEFFIRKGTHFLTFGCLALFLYRLLRHFFPPSVAIPWTGFTGIGIAALDEWHQTLTPGRTGMVADVLLDTSGIIVALLLIGLASVVRHNTSRKIGHNRFRGYKN